jgi:TfoX/Sxy family transcriptional regulator of competence genes
LFGGYMIFVLRIVIGHDSDADCALHIKKILATN